MSRTKDFYWDEICAMAESPGVNDPGEDAEYERRELAPHEQEMWEMHRDIDACFVHIGRMDKTLDLMTEIANAVGIPTTGKYPRFANSECPF